MEQVRGSMEGNACLSGQLSGHPPTNDYEKLSHKPRINGVELSGDKSFEDLGMDQVFATKKELENKFKELVDGNEVEY